MSVVQGKMEVNDGFERLRHTEDEEDNEEDDEADEEADEDVDEEADEEATEKADDEADSFWLNLYRSVKSAITLSRTDIACCSWA
jgi:hypothetical protein